MDTLAECACARMPCFSHFFCPPCMDVFGIRRGSRTEAQISTSMSSARLRPTPNHAKSIAPLERHAMESMGPHGLQHDPGKENRPTEGPRKSASAAEHVPARRQAKRPASRMRRGGDEGRTRYQTYQGAGSRMGKVLASAMSAAQPIQNTPTSYVRSRTTYGAKHNGEGLRPMGAPSLPVQTHDRASEYAAARRGQPARMLQPQQYRRRSARRKSGHDHWNGLVEAGNNRYQCPI